MPHDIFPDVLPPRQYLREMFGGCLGIAQLNLVFGYLAGDWTITVIAFVAKNL